ncbi:nitroreductase family protein [Micromonospora sp. NBC_01699]|uniref:nitroreductase family protein n=1 Tax=Micromonospora sp. NBC_01699 TaxID=2975984 RepID=UPI002E31835C|nr:nitroreductase family protein [Micromonospora sp. NBC_01699]
MTASLSLSAEDLLSTTRAVRLRLDLTRPVEPEVIKRCVELACQAPTGRNRQRWDFVVVTDPGRRRALADLYRLGLRAPTQPVPYDGVDRSAGDPAAQQRMSRSAQHLFEHLHEVPALVVPTVRVVRVREPSIVHQANTWGSILPAVWSFMLAARAHGLGTAWTTPHLHYEREAAELLGIPYATVMQVALSPLAYTIGTDFRVGPRVDVGEVLHLNRW